VKRVVKCGVEWILLMFWSSILFLHCASKTPKSWCQSSKKGTYS
jgi:hypothetical protein